MVRGGANKVENLAQGWSQAPRKTRLATISLVVAKMLFPAAASLAFISGDGFLWVFPVYVLAVLLAILLSASQMYNESQA
jgi:hypothetical protein